MPARRRTRGRLGLPVTAAGRPPASPGGRTTDGHRPRRESTSKTIRRARSQFRVGRRDPVKPIIVVHTAESGTDRSGADPKAENVANFIRGRSTAGSYHLVGDADSIIQLIRFDNEAFHDRTGSNRWAIGISLAMNAGDWPSLSASRRAEFVATAGQMAAIAARWLRDRGLELPEPRLLTKTESDRLDASGFISHARRDPTRRSDPGAGFPWTSFFAAYQPVPRRRGRRSQS